MGNPNRRGDPPRELPAPRRKRGVASEKDDTAKDPGDRKATDDDRPDLQPRPVQVLKHLPEKLPFARATTSAQKQPVVDPAVPSTESVEAGECNVDVEPDTGTEREPQTDSEREPEPSIERGPVAPQLSEASMLPDEDPFQVVQSTDGVEFECESGQHADNEVGPRKKSRFAQLKFW